MFDPSNIKAILSFSETDFGSLPKGEDQVHEYKSSLVKDGELAEKIRRAASGFWNSGGGLMVIGVDATGQPDGGVSLTVGRQARRDWTDQHIAQVAPRARYEVQCVQSTGGSTNIQTGNAVVLIAFAPSEAGPHMAPDNKYYIRAGAHTEPASHFIVEALYARRGSRLPVLRHVIRRKPDVRGVLQLGIVSLSSAAAFGVEITFDPLPESLQGIAAKQPLLVPVISEQFPSYFDIHLITMGRTSYPAFRVVLKYHDSTGQQHTETLLVDLEKQLGPSLGSPRGGRELVQAVEKAGREVQKAGREVAKALKDKR